MAAAKLMTVTLFRREMRQLLRFAFPLFIAQSAQMGTGVVDTIMAARYGEQDLAAISIGINIWLPVYLLILGTVFATATIVAQDFGGGRIEKIRQQLPQSLWVAVFLGLTLSPAIWYAGPILDLLGLNPITRQLALDYAQMVALGMPATAIFQALRYHTQGLGITQPFAFAAVAGFLLNVPLNYAFIFGEWGAPELGAKGCGIATAISMWLSVFLIGAYVLRSKKIRLYLPEWKPVAPDWVKIREILSVGAPIGLTFFLEMGVFSVIALLVASLGDTAISSHQIAFNVWDLFYIPMLAIGTAMSTRIGHAIGAGWREGIYRAMIVGGAISALVSLGTMMLLISFPGAIIGIYTDAPDIQLLATRLLTLSAFFILIDGAQIVGSFILRAYKETQFPFIMMVISYWLVALPLGWWLGIELPDNPNDGAAGFWYATITGISVCTVLIGARIWVILGRDLPTSATE
ncbi:MAG: MATE family efflux transporter [Halieaceae bacterium]|nr:MATE family efflux transporter [Halieaceae bacterium]